MTTLGLNSLSSIYGALQPPISLSESVSGSQKSKVKAGLNSSTVKLSTVVHGHQEPHHQPGPGRSRHGDQTPTANRQLDRETEWFFLLDHLLLQHIN